MTTHAERLNYYKNYFPINLLVQILTRNYTLPLKHCEFDFTLCGGTHEFHLRYRRFETQEALDLYLEEYPEAKIHVPKIPWMFEDAFSLQNFLCRHVPNSVHVGPIFPNINRQQARQTPYICRWKPLIFDIDMDDYDRFIAKSHGCNCEARTVCNVCWACFMKPALEILHYILGQIFGFTHLLTVFSGRRGFHCWVLDNRVWAWTDAQRKLCVKNVQSYAHWIPNSPHHQYISQQLLNHAREWIDRPLTDVECMRYFFPKLDHRVTSSTMHLTKIPFGIHSATGNLCLPIDSTWKPSQAIHVRDVSKETIGNFIQYGLSEELMELTK